MSTFRPGDVVRHKDLGGVEHVLTAENVEAIERDGVQHCYVLVRRVWDMSFRECAACKAKPGSPVLCPSCRHNRAVINYLSMGLYERPERCTCPGPGEPHILCPMHGR